MALIEAKDLSLGYDGRAILEQLNFTVNAGDYLCIVGENGSGKTTLMKTLLGLAEPLAGEIVFGDGLAKDAIGYLPQQTDAQKDFPASCREIVLSGFQGKTGFRPFYSAEEKKAAFANMERMGIADLANRSFSALSGGQRQRVLLARALSATRKLLLLDEPVAGLDPNAMNVMYGRIAELNRDGITVIMITHDVRAAVRFATHVLHIGSTVFFGTRDAYLRSGAGRYFLRGEAWNYGTPVKREGWGFEAPAQPEPAAGISAERYFAEGADGSSPAEPEGGEKE